MKQTILALLMSAVVLSTGAQTPVAIKTALTVSEIRKPGYFPISDAVIYTDAKDYKVVDITAHMLADDVERVTGRRPQVTTATSVKNIPKGVSVAVGTVGSSRLIDELVRQKTIDVSACIFRRYPFTNSDDIRSLGW